VKPVGVGILSYYGLGDVQRAVESVRAATTTPHRVLVFDNSENDEVGEWIRHHAGDVACVRSPYNVGCAQGRNRMSEWFAERGFDHFVLMDQDVTVLPAADGASGDWLADLRGVFARHKDTGVASWHLAIRQMSPRSGDYRPDKTGVVAEVPGMCCMYSLECVRKVGGWQHDMLMYRFDTLFCLKAAKAGLKTRVVWPDTDRVRHNHPHGGVKRFGRAGREQARSRTIFASEVKRCGLRVPQGLGA